MITHPRGATAACRHAAATGWTAAGGLKQLKLLDLGSTQITDAGCATLAAASHFELLHLERLILSFTQITDAAGVPPSPP